MDTQSIHQDVESIKGQLTVDENKGATPQDSSVPSNLFFHFFPLFLSESLQKKLAVRQEVSLWQSWIAGGSEALVLDKVHKNQLPADNSLLSQLKRASYRTRVLQTYVTRSSSWITDFERDKTNEDLVEGAELSSKIQQLLPDIGSDSVGFRKTLGLMAPYMSEIAHGSKDEHSYWYILTSYEYDTTSDSFHPVIRTIFYSIKPATEPKLDGKFHLCVLLTSKKFIQDSWSKAWNEMSDADHKKVTNNVESLLASRTFNFAIES